MTSTPSIRISRAHQRLHSPPARPASSVAAAPMAVPGALEPVPPPLPPPTHIPEISAGQDPGWQWGNDPNSADFGRSALVKPGSSLLGGSYRQVGWEKERESESGNITDARRRESSISTVTAGHSNEMLDENSPCAGHEDDEGYLSRPSSTYRLHALRQLEQKILDESSKTYDNQLLSRIGGPSTPSRQNISYSPSAQDTTQGESERTSGQLRPLPRPERRLSVADSPGSARWPQSGPVSPSFTGTWSEYGPPDINRGPRTRHGSVLFEDSVPHRGSYDQSSFLSEELMEDGQLGSLHIHDRSPAGLDDYQLGLRTGSKRRASSPPREAAREDRNSVSSASGQGDFYHRRSLQQLPTRSSPISRFHPSHSSVSSASSYSGRHGSLGSSLGVASVPSSATSYGSGGRLSPSNLSPNQDADQRHGTPYHGVTLTTPNHQRSATENAPNSLIQATQTTLNHSRQGSLTHKQGPYICECCPKKPKKFDTAEGLRLHESEKSYTCAYCPNRFKNKNEAERHQNSLHLRRHSWSCSALTGIEAAFTMSLSANGTDTCGYCGKEFSNPPQWDIRAEHLNVEHKFGECNHTKKFFRADHFRQHLKHSHNGTSGKWTNHLETTCQRDEPLPAPRVSPSGVAASVSQGPPALMVTTSGWNVSSQE